MKRKDFIEKGLRRDRFMVIGAQCEMADKEKVVIRNTADEMFNELMEFYEVQFGEETFDLLMGLMTDFISSKEYGLSLIFQDMLLLRAGLLHEATELQKLLGENPTAADMYLKQMHAKAIIYHDYLISDPCEIYYTCRECPYKGSPECTADGDYEEPEENSLPGEQEQDKPDYEETKEEELEEGQTDAADTSAEKKSEDSFFDNFNEIREDIQAALDDAEAPEEDDVKYSEEPDYDGGSFYADFGDLGSLKEEAGEDDE